MERFSFDNKDCPKRYSENPASTGTGQFSFGNNIASDKNIVNNKEQFYLADLIRKNKNLVAVHNSGVEGLTKSVKLGVLSSRSIAIEKEKTVTQNNGDVLNKSTIDPATSLEDPMYFHPTASATARI